MLPDFHLVMPRTLPEALDALSVADGCASPLAGGTNLLVDLRAKRAAADRLVSLADIAELQGVARNDGHVTVGACTTLSDLLRNPIVAEEAPALVAAARMFGGAMVRNTATVGGNLCHGSPAADLVPPLLALDAAVVLRNVEAGRIVPLDDFYLVVDKTMRRPDELLTEVRWSRPPPRSASLFCKLGLRKGDAIAVTSVAVSLSAENGVCSRARIALGAVAPVVMRSSGAEALLTGRPLTQSVIDEAARQAADDCAPIDDIRATAEYRRHVVEALTRRLVTQAAQALN